MVGIYLKVNNIFNLKEYSEIIISIFLQRILSKNFLQMKEITYFEKSKKADLKEMVLFVIFRLGAIQIESHGYEC